MKAKSLKVKPFSGECKSTILEQWKTCVESANSITEKRNNSNNIFITINTALFAVITFSFDCKSILLSIIGILICILWICLISSYRKLNIVKYEIINEIEKELPLAPFTSEWEKLNIEQKYINLTTIEKILPCLFIILYSISIIYPVFKIILTFICPCMGGTVS